MLVAHNYKRTCLIFVMALSFADQIFGAQHLIFSTLLCFRAWIEDREIDKALADQRAIDESMWG